MEQVLIRVNKPIITFNRAVFLVVASLLMVLISIYLFSASLESPMVTKYSGYDFSNLNIKLVSIFSCISLPLALVAVSQILIKYRGVHGGMWALFWGSAIMLIAQAPFVMALIGSATA